MLCVFYKTNDVSREIVFSLTVHLVGLVELSLTSDTIEQIFLVMWHKAGGASVNDVVRGLHVASVRFFSLYMPLKYPGFARGRNILWGCICE